jgi:hypothetical protein
MDILTENDPISEGSREAGRPVQGRLSCYKDMLQEGKALGKAINSRWLLRKDDCQLHGN